jgi:hypothetical protein
MTLRKSKRPKQVSAARQGEALAGVRSELPAWIGILENVRSGLLRAAASITPSPSEADPEVDLDKMDEPTEVRSVLGNVAEDDLRAAIEDLRKLLKKGES